MWYWLSIDSSLDFALVGLFIDVLSYEIFYFEIEWFTRHNSYTANTVWKYDKQNTEVRC